MLFITEQEYNFNLVARTDGMVTKRAEKQVNTIDCEFIHIIMFLSNLSA